MINSLKADRTLIMIDFACGAGLLICVLMSSYALFSYIALALIIAFLLYVLVYKKTFFIKYLAYFFSGATAIAGTAIIELGPTISLVELGTSSRFVGSLPLLVLGYWLLFVFLLHYDISKGSDLHDVDIAFSKQSLKTLNRITALVLVLFGILFSRIATHPAFLLGLNRFQYASEYATAGTIITIFTSIAPYLLIFPILSLMYGNKYLGAITVLLYALYYIWLGNKFGPFFSLMCIFLLVYYKRILSLGKMYLKRIIAVAAILFVLLIILSGFFATLNGSYSRGDYFLQRGAQQGQLWWSTYDISDETHPGEFHNEIESITLGKNSVAENVGSQYGIYKIMYLCAPKTMVDFKLSTGARYTEAGFASVYYYFGPLGVVLFSIICGLVFSATLNSFIKALNHKDYIRAMIMLRFFMLQRGALSMFVFLDFFDALSIASYIYLLLFFGKKVSISYGGKGLSLRIASY